MGHKSPGLGRVTRVLHWFGSGYPFFLGLVFFLNLDEFCVGLGQFGSVLDGLRASQILHGPDLSRVFLGKHSRNPSLVHGFAGF
jgi:hypothetical protein